MLKNTVMAMTLLLLPSFYYQAVLATQGAYFQTDVGFSNEAVERPWYYGDGEGLRRRCPHCDSSVYSYCSEKLFHDSCCCHNPNNPYDEIPYQCHFADCSFLHANSCADHKLITACCCISRKK